MTEAAFFFIPVNLAPKSLTPPFHAFTGLVTPPPTQRGKVRDVYLGKSSRLLVATDRISAFDRVVGAVAGRGQILNQLAAWWLREAQTICHTHLLEVVDAHTTHVANAQVLPVEVIVRGFITGSTKTSLWTLYEAGQREAYDVPLPDGLHKNDRLPQPVITPTSKADDGGHDTPMTPTEIVKSGVVAPQLWAQIEEVALGLFQLGQTRAEAAGLVLVDTKYEFGLVNGKLTLIDEVHTPDSSRYWSLASWLDDPANPTSLDKEQLRLWLAQMGYRGEGSVPTLSAEIQTQIVTRYAQVFAQLTGSPMTYDTAASDHVDTSVTQFLAAARSTQ